jgi:hypothetical protein
MLEQPALRWDREHDQEDRKGHEPMRVEYVVR